MCARLREGSSDSTAQDNSRAAGVYLPATGQRTSVITMENWIRRLMMPLADFAVVERGATALDALRALERAQRRVPPGRQLHRSVLVRDRRGRYVGKVGQRAILRALVPQSRELFSGDLLDQAGVSEEMKHISMQRLELLRQDLDEICARAAFHEVDNLLMSVPESVDVDAPISEVIRAFSERDILSLLVTEDERVIGVLRMEDLFGELSRRVLERIDSGEIELGGEE
ncbi:MAG: hypothetical protein MAG453_01571 [Calditrichaeota bacterium]|nr:hypothetical protein [Calditrichota bacterium]